MNMKKYNWDYKFESFLDRKESGVFFDVYVGSGRPQRLYPETAQSVTRRFNRGITRLKMMPGLMRSVGWPTFIPLKLHGN